MPTPPGFDAEPSSGDRGRWDGDEYQQRMAERAAALRAAGGDPHGEVALVMTFAPDRVLDAGCGTGRVAVELARRGRETGAPSTVVGVDVDASMLEVARAASADVRWVEADLCDFALTAADGTPERFDVVVMAGNVPLFTPAGTQPALVDQVAAHVAPDGVLIAGFSTAWAGREYTTDDYDRDLGAAGHVVVERYATWEGEPWTPAADYAVTVSRPRSQR